MPFKLMTAGALLAACCSCSSSDSPAPPSSPPPSNGFTSYEGLDPGAVALISDDQFGVGQSVHVASDGTVWLWRGRLLQHYSRDGELLAQKNLGEEGADGGPSSVVFHPNGEFTVIRTRYRPAGTAGKQMAITEFTRLSPSLGELKRVQVSGEESLGLLEYHEVFADGTFTSKPGEVVSNPGFHLTGQTSVIADSDNGLYAVDTRHRLVHLDENYSMVATTWLLPNADLPITGYLEGIDFEGKPYRIPLRQWFVEPRLLVDHDHRVWVLSGAPVAANGVLTQHLGRTVDLREGYDLFVARYTPSLKLESVVSLPAKNDQSSRPWLAENAGHIGVAALSHEKREVGPNKTFNYNVYFGVLDENGQRLAENDFDMERDEVPYALSSCGDGFCIGGETNTVWVDTGSQVDFGKGFILKVNAAAQRERLWTLHGPRRNSVESVDVGADGTLFFSGFTNGAITHTPENERRQQAVFGRLQF